MKSNHSIVLCLATTCGALTGSLSAATLLTYNFNDTSPTATDVSTYVNPTDYDPRIAAIGNGTTDSGISGGGNAFIRSGQVGGLANITPTTTDPSTSNAYHAFSFTVQNLVVGESLNLTSINFDFLSGNTGASQSYTISLYSSASGYVDTGDLLGSTTNTGSGVGLNSPESYDLTSANANAGNSFTGLVNDDVVEFRFYFSDNVNDNARVLRTDNIVLSGDVIPEPSSALLGGLGALVLLRRRR